MLGGSGDLRIRVGFHPKKWWLLIPLEVATGGNQVVTLTMILDTGSPLSGISAPVRDVLLREGCLTAIGQTEKGKGVYLLKGVRIQGQIAPDLHVRVSPRATRFGLDGILGLTFLGHFRHISFDVESMELTLKSR